MQVESQPRGGHQSSNLQNCIQKRSWSSSNKKQRAESMGSNEDIEEAEIVSESSHADHGVAQQSFQPPPPPLNQQESEIVEEAEVIENNEDESSRESLHKDVTDESDSDTSSDDEFLLPKDWYGSFPEEAYGRIIDAARLTAERAYDRNGAVVGALAEAGGDDGAAERWLLGFISLLGDKHLPEWWNQSHQEALLEVARSRRGDYFIKRCVDPKVLKKRLGSKDFSHLDIVAFEVISCFIMPQHDDGDGAYDDKELELTFPKSAIAQAKAIWGEETVKELTKKTQEEYEQERQSSDMIKQVKMEEGHWWGTATNDAPEKAYYRLIDAARFGTMLAYEQRVSFIGSIADAVEGEDLGGIDDEQDTQTKGDIQYSPEGPGPN